MKRKMILISVLSLLMLAAAVAPAFAKNFNVPEGVSISYWTGGDGFIEPPADWPPGGIHPTALKISAEHFEAVASVRDVDAMFISVPYPLNPSIWIPVAYFGITPDGVVFVRTVMSGFPVASPTNSKQVSDNELKVERHGNRITAELTAPQTIFWSKLGGGYIPVVIPAFTIEMDEVDGSVHQDDSHSYTGYPGASGYTEYDDEMGFNANGVFTCTSWSYVAHPMTECFITMHGISTFVPPPPP